MLVATPVVVLFFVLLVSLTALDVATRQLGPRGPAPTAADAFYRH